MIKKIFANRFINATFWVFLAMGFTNVGNYFYHFVMLGLLKSPKLFGELEAAISMFFLFAVPLTTASLAVVKFISEANGRGNKEEVADLYHFFQKYLIVIGIITTGLLLLLAPFITSFLHFSSLTIGILLAVNFFASLLSVFGKSVLQGLTDFFGMAIANFLEAAAKLGFAALFVILGYQVAGAFFAITVSCVVGYVVAILYLRRHKFARSHNSVDQKRIISYAVPLCITSFAMTSLISTDVVLVRHFFPGAESGYYSFLSVLGKIIFFLSAPLTTVMFPMISEQHAKGGKYSHYLFITLGLTSAGVAAVVLIYFLFPEFIISFFPQKDYYLSLAPYLGLFGLVVGMYSIAAVLSNFYFSIHKTSCTYIIVTAAITQIVLITLFHQTIFQVVYDSLIAMSILLFGFLLYYPHATKK